MPAPCPERARRRCWPKTVGAQWVVAQTSIGCGREFRSSASLARGVRGEPHSRLLRGSAGVIRNSRSERVRPRLDLCGGGQRYPSMERWLTVRKLRLLQRCMLPLRPHVSGSSRCDPRDHPCRTALAGVDRGGVTRPAWHARARARPRRERAGKAVGAARRASTRAHRAPCSRT